MQATEWEVKEQELDKLQKAIDYYKEEAKTALQQKHLLELENSTNKNEMEENDKKLKNLKHKN